MPRGDGTGPNGMGSMTGRAAGYCSGYNMPGFANPGFGQGRGFWGFGLGRGRGWWGRGRGFGWSRFGIAQSTPIQQPGSVDELSELKLQAEYMKISLDRINSRIQQLSDKS